MPSLLFRNKSNSSKNLRRTRCLVRQLFTNQSINFMILLGGQVIVSWPDRLIFKLLMSKWSCTLVCGPSRMCLVKSSRFTWTTTIFSITLKCLIVGGVVIEFNKIKFRVRLEIMVLKNTAHYSWFHVSCFLCFISLMHETWICQLIPLLCLANLILFFQSQKTGHQSHLT